LVVLLVGVAIVIADGQLIMRHSPSYLVEACRDPRQARQVARMVAPFFHLVMLGVVLLVTSGLDPNPTVPAVLRRLGTLLILTAIGHAATMLVLSRLREQQTGTELANAQMDAPPATAPAAVTGPDGVTRAPAVPDTDLSGSAATRRGLVAGRGRAARCRYLARGRSAVRRYSLGRRTSRSVTITADSERGEAPCLVLPTS
jgi:hypothetical protein